MSQHKKILKLAVRIVFCFSALTFLFSIFTSKASLQNNSNATNAVRVSNVNTARKMPTPRRSPRPSVNTAANAVSMPVPTPTPPAASTVRGRVFYADTGRAVKRSMVMLMNEDGGGSGSTPSALTDSEGNFVMKNVRGGTYYAMVNAPGVVSPLAYADFSKKEEKEGLKNAFDNFDKIIVDGVTEIYVQIGARRGGAIGGRVTYDDGDAAIGVKVEILRKVGDKFFGVVPNFGAIIAMMTGGGNYQTDDRGVYRFAGLPPGDYIVKVTENATHGDGNTRNYDPFESMITGGTSLLTVFYPDTAEPKAAQIINIQLGQEFSEINLVIPSRNLYKLEGRVVNRKDKSPVRARILLKREADDKIFSIFSELGRRREIAVSTDENGNWQFKELPKGVYRIVVDPVEDTDTESYPYGDGLTNAPVRNERNTPPKPKLAKKSEELTIEDKDLSEIVVELGYGAAISGTVVVENSQEMPNAVIIRTIGEKDETSVSGGVLNYGDYEGGRPTKFNHDFKLESVPEGKTYFSVSAGDDDYYVKSATLDGTDLLGNPLEIKEGDNLRNVRIVLAKDTGTLKGVVLSDDKEPVKGVNLAIVPTDAARRRNPGNYRNASTNQNGEFEIKAAPGEYAIVFFDRNAPEKSREELLKWLDEAVKDAQTVKLEPGRTETVTVKKKN